MIKVPLDDVAEDEATLLALLRHYQEKISVKQR